MPDQHYIVEIRLRHQIIATMDVMAANPNEAKMIGSSQIRIHTKKGYGKVEGKEPTDSGLPDFKKPKPEPEKK